MTANETPDPETARALLWRHNLPEDVIDGALALFAQELAGKIRAHRDHTRGAVQATKVMDFAADLISPEHWARTVPAVVSSPPATDRATEVEQLREQLQQMTAARDVLASLYREADAAARIRTVAEAIASLEKERDRTDVNVAAYPRYDQKQRSAFDSGIGVLRRLVEQPAVGARQPDTEPLPLLFWDEAAGVVHHDGRVTAWLSKAVNLAQSIPAGQLILRVDVAQRLRRALTTALNDAAEQPAGGAGGVADETGEGDRG